MILSYDQMTPVQSKNKEKVDIDHVFGNLAYKPPIEVGDL
jgi:hypothetical protein